MAKYTLKFEKFDENDFLELPVIYTTKKEGGKSSKEIWEEYLEAYNFTRKKVEYYIENLSKIKSQLEEDFNGFEWLSKDTDNKS